MGIYDLKNCVENIDEVTESVFIRCHVGGLRIVTSEERPLSAILTCVAGGRLSGFIRFKDFCRGAFRYNLTLYQQSQKTMAQMLYDIV